MKFSIKQTEVLDILEDNIHNEIVFGGGVSGGKSVVGCYWILKQCYKYPGSRHLIGRSMLSNLRNTTLKTFFEVCKLQGVIKGVDFNYNQQTNTILFTNGSEILLKDLFQKPSDFEFDALGGVEVTSVLCEEIAELSLKAWQVLKSRIRYKLDEFGLIPKIMGTCNPSKNWVYADYYKPNLDGTLEPYKAFIQSLISDNPFVSKEYVKSLNQMDNASKQRLLFGNWDYDNDPSALLTYDQILDLFNNSHVLSDVSKKAITADIAMEGADKMVLTYWQGFVAEKIKVIPKTTGKDVIDAIELMAKTYGVPKSRIVFDGDGVGNFIGSKDGTSGFLQGAKSFKNGSKALNDENYKNLKTQCIYKFAQRASEAGYWIKDVRYRDEIVPELEQLKRANSDNDTGKLEVLCKEKIKQIIGHSPDFSDSLIMREFLELKRAGFFV
ncbi:phage terminase large subunit [Pedobacter cryoconitis]|uniref:PBSX family phage terminase large subunit n=1 Tax=Pedobacter cryoconitis TaxID=188932 RepID=A0A327S7P5_9SPHI|nr:phage terminase large subunit [Pedobacter cryoconitis]RAJ24986.1 PBSX family phage terminase large subunit [Pedobacter cryoconitis]